MWLLWPLGDDCLGEYEKIRMKEELAGGVCQWNDDTCVVLVFLYVVFCFIRRNLEVCDLIFIEE